jgi:hypothetical protein
MSKPLHRFNPKRFCSPTDSSNFRNDVNATGTVNNTDVGITKANVPTQLPPQSERLTHHF